MVDLRSIALRKVERRLLPPAVESASSAASTIPTLSRGRRAARSVASLSRYASDAGAAASGPHEAFDLGFRPGERLFERLALHEAHHHLGGDRLGINLHGDLRRRGLRRN